MKAAFGLCLAWCRDQDDFLVVQTSSFGNCQSFCYRDAGAEAPGATGPFALHTSPIVPPQEDQCAVSTVNGGKKVSTEGAEPVDQGWHQPLPSNARPRKSILKKKKKKQA
jgi:hypothetical protein